MLKRFCDRCQREANSPLTPVEINDGILNSDVSEVTAPYVRLTTSGRRSSELSEHTFDLCFPCHAKLGHMVRNFMNEIPKSNTGMAVSCDQR